MILEALVVGGLFWLTKNATEPGGLFGGPEVKSPPPGAPDPLCVGNDAALQKASKRQWSVCVRLARKYKSTWPANWRCLAGTSSDGMERVFQAWVNEMARRAAALDLEAMEALLYAEGLAFEAFGQKIGTKVKESIAHVRKVTGNAFDKVGGAVSSGVNAVKKGLGL